MHACVVSPPLVRLSCYRYCLQRESSEA